MKRNTYYKFLNYDAIYVFPKDSTTGTSLFPDGTRGIHKWNLADVLSLDTPAVRISRKEAEKFIGRKVFRANVI